MENEKFVPMLGNDFNYFNLHPSLNFFDDRVLLGFWIPTKTTNSNNIKEDLWFWDGERIKHWKELVNENGFFLQNKVYFEKRISDSLLLNGIKDSINSVFSELMNLVNVDIKLQECKDLNSLVSEVLSSLNSLNSLSNGNIGSNDIDFKNTIEKEKYLWSYISIFTKYISSLIEKKLKFYIDFEDPRYYSLISFFVMGTYFFELFDSFPYLFIHGVKRSGKTTILRILEKLCFNAILTGNISASSVFRLADGIRPTLLIDEADALVNPKNAENLRLMLLNGYKKGNKIIRTEKKGERVDFKVIRFNVYCPKVLVNIKGIDDVLEDRTIYINIRRTPSKEYSNRVTLIEKDPVWQFIRDCLYVYLVTGWKIVKKEYDNLENNTKLTNRDWELWKPLLVFSRFAEKYNEMVEFAEEKTQEKIIEDVVEQRDTLLVKVLCSMVESDNYYKVSDIKERFKGELDEDERGFLTAKWIGSALRRLGFKNKRRTGGGVEYFLSKKEVENLAKRMGITETEGQEQTEPEEEKTLQERIREFILEKCNAEDGYSIIKLLEKDIVKQFGQEVYDLAFEIFEQLKQLGLLFESQPDRFKTVK